MSDLERLWLPRGSTVRVPVAEDFYLLPVCGSMPPCPGDLVRVNYGSSIPMRVLSCQQITKYVPYYLEVGTWSLHCKMDQNGAESWFNEFKLLEDGRFCRRPWLPGSAGYLSNGGGLGGDGRDEIRVVKRAPQGRLFA